MIYTASFFKPEDHVDGSILLCIANSRPPGFATVKYSALTALRPGKLLRQYNDGELSWDEYRKAYLAQLEDRREFLYRFFVGAVPGTNFTLLCWERDPENCHRKWAAEFLSTLGCEVTIR